MINNNSSGLELLAINNFGSFVHYCLVSLAIAHVFALYKCDWFCTTFALIKFCQFLLFLILELLIAYLHLGSFMYYKPEIIQLNVYLGSKNNKIIYDK